MLSVYFEEGNYRINFLIHVGLDFFSFYLEPSESQFIIVVKL